MSGISPDQQILIDNLKTDLERQPWYARFSNTVTSGAGAVSLVIWTLIAGGVDIPDSVERWVAVGIAGLTTLGVLKTKNGLTPRGIQRVEDTALES